VFKNNSFQPIFETLLVKTIVCLCLSIKGELRHQSHCAEISLLSTSSTMVVFFSAAPLLQSMSPFALSQCALMLSAIFYAHATCMHEKYLCCCTLSGFFLYNRNKFFLGGKIERVVKKSSNKSGCCGTVGFEVC